MIMEPVPHTLPAPLCRSIAFDKPDRLVQPSAWETHIPFAFWLIDVHRPKIVVELGVHAGNSYCAFLQAAKKLQLPAQCYGVDTWRGDRHAGYYDESVYSEISRYHDDRYSHFSRLIRSTFDDVLDYFADGTIDLLHIDGLHTYEAVKHDFEAWLPKLSKSGVVLMHDSNVKEHEFGVWRLWEELSRKYPHFRFDHGHGLGVLGVGKDISDDLKWLFGLSASDPEQTAVVRSFFSGLGAALSDRLGMAGANSRLRGYEDVSQRLHLQVNDLRRLKVKLAERTVESALLRQQASHLGASLSDLQVQLSERAKGAGTVRARSIAGAALDAVLARLHLSARTSRNQSLIKRSGLFDADWYLATSANVAAERANPIAHYLRHGAAQGRDPHPLFDSDWYLGRYPDVAAMGMNPLVHFLRNGAAEGRDPHPLFASEWYVSRYPDVATSGVNPLIHYLQRGAAEGRDPSPLFSTAWYLSRHPEVAASNENPLLHYLRHGVSPAYDPNPLFDTAWYLTEHPDVARAGVNPLVHYVASGAAAGYNPNPMFDTYWYLGNNPDVAAKRQNPLAHFLEVGAAERRNPVHTFHSDWYVEHASVPPSMNPLAHYLQTGLRNAVAPNSLVPMTRVEAVAQRIAADQGFRPTASSVGPTSHFPLPPTLEHFLHLALGESVVTQVRWSYHFLDFYSATRIDDPSRDINAELRQLIDEVAGLVGRKKHRPQESVDATIIIPVHDKLTYTLCCLKAILAAPMRCSYEIIVADDASKDATPSVLGGFGSIVRLLRSDDNQGFVRTCNAAAAQSRGEIIVFLNNDTIPLPGWLDEMVDTLRADPTIGLAGPKYLNFDGTIQEAGGLIWNDGRAENFGRGRNPNDWTSSHVKDVDYVSGAALAVLAKAWREVGGFDDAYAPAYYEDVDLAFRVRAAGLRTVYQPFSVVIHFEGVSHGKDPAAGIKLYQVRNQATFYARWRDTLAIENLVPGSDADARGAGHNSGRPRILIIDHYAPRPDRDSGSRAMFDYIKVFANAGFHVTFWPQNLQYDREYTPPLQRLGVEVIYSVGPVNPDFYEWITRNGASLDYVLISRPTVADGYIDHVAARSNAKIIYFGVDIHYQRTAREYKTTGSAVSRQAMFELEKLERRIWSKSDAIYYYSNEERDFIAGEYPDKVARAVPVFLFDLGRLASTRRRLLKSGIAGNKQVIFVAGFAHAPNVDAVFWLASRIWPTVLTAVPDARLCIVGSSPPPEVLALAGPSIVVTGPVSDAVLHLLYQTSSLSLVPLRYGAGVKGKVLEAISLGVPVVTTRTGIEGIIGGANLVELCEGEEALAAAVIETLRNPGSRIAKVLAGLDYLETHMSEAAARRVLALDVPELSETETTQLRPAMSGAV